MNSLFISILLILLAVCPAHAEIVISTDFEDVENWSTQRSWGSVLFPHSWNQKSGGATYAPPKKTNGDWLFPSYWFRCSGSEWPALYQKQMINIADSLGRNNSRGLEYNVEATGYATGGSPLTVYLGDTGYQDVYVSYWAEYDPSWNWPETSPYVFTSMHKMVYIGRQHATLTDSTSDAHFGGTIYPAWYPHWVPHLDGVNDYFYYLNRGVSETTTGLTTYDNIPDLGSNHPDYYPEGTPIKWDTYKTGWHHYEFRAKMNSAPGVADGIQQVWVDGVLRFDKQDREWVSGEGTSVTPGFNVVQLSDNVFLGAQENTTYYVRYDNFVVSTTRVGTEYPLGLQTPPTTTASKPAGRYRVKQSVALASEPGVTTKYCLTPGCTPTATYTEPVPVLKNIAYQVLRYSSVDASNNTEPVKELVFRKQKRR